MYSEMFLPRGDNRDFSIRRTRATMTGRLYVNHVNSSQVTAAAGTIII